MRYSNVVFAGTALVWLMNALASVIRGTGNMFVPALAICVGVVLLVPLSPCLIFGLGPFPALGIAGGGVAVRVHHGADRVRCWPGTSCRAAAWCGFRLVPAALAAVPRHPAGRRGRLGHHAADHPDRRVDHRAGRRRRRARCDRRLRHRRRGSSICWCRWCSASARRWSRWSAPTSAPASASGRCASR